MSSPAIDETDDSDEIFCSEYQKILKPQTASKIETQKPKKSVFGL